MIRDVISGGVLFALSAGYYVTATQFPVSALDTTVTASAFPEMIGVLGAGLSAALVAQAIWRLTRARAADDAEDVVDPLQDRSAHRAALGLLAIIALFLIALGSLGYPLALACMIFAVATSQGIPIGWKSAAFAIGGAAFFWLFFVQFLGIHMPVGFWQRSAMLPFPLVG